MVKYTTLAKIRRYASKSGSYDRAVHVRCQPELLYAKKIPQGAICDATLQVRIGSNVYIVRFNSFHILCRSLSFWRNLYGAPLFVNGAIHCGTINGTNH